MKKPQASKAPKVFQLATTGNPRLIGVDYGADDIATLTEVEIHSDGTMKILAVDRLSSKPDVSARKPR